MPDGDDLVDVPVRVLNETDTGWLVTQRPVGRRGAMWLDKAAVQIPDRLEIKPMLTARMPRALAKQKGMIPA